MDETASDDFGALLPQDTPPDGSRPARVLPPDLASPAAVQAWTEAQLRQDYQATLDEPLPERLLALLRPRAKLP